MKSEKRAYGRAVRKTVRSRKRAEQQICSTILELTKNCGTVLLYHAIDGEADLSPLFGSYQQVLLPRVEGDRLIPSFAHHAPLKKSAFGIQEPTAEPFTGSIDAVIVPLCAFDETLSRIGFGKGFYDRFLQDKHCLKIGAAFDCQKVDDTEKTELDIRLDAIVTEKQVYR